jgi:hypothetical protein
MTSQIRPTLNLPPLRAIRSYPPGCPRRRLRDDSWAAMISPAPVASVDAAPMANAIPAIRRESTELEDLSLTFLEDLDIGASGLATPPTLGGL